ncbi:hypothetical protein pb186bvf_012312 [Paramecium bursaria]
MIINLTKDQAKYIKQQLPDAYNLKKIEKEQPEAIEFKEQQECYQLILRLKKTETFRQLSNKENTQIYHQKFVELFGLFEEVFKYNKKNLLQKEIIYAQLWIDLNKLIRRIIIQSTKEQTKYVYDIEKHFNKIFVIYQKQCIQQMHLMLSPDGAKQTKSDKAIIRQPPNERQKQKLIDKLQKLPQHAFKYIADYLNVQADEFELDLDQLDPIQYKKIELFVNNRVNQKKLNQLYKKYKKDTQSDCDDFSFQSFLTDSQELMENK